MTELISRFSEGEKYFIDGMTNVYVGMSGVENTSELSTVVLFHIFDFCLSRFKDDRSLRFEINNRWKQNEDKEDLYDDLYDGLFDDWKDFFTMLESDQW
jgi:hypothetical protein